MSPVAGLRWRCASAAPSRAAVHPGRQGEPRTSPRRRVTRSDYFVFVASEGNDRIALVRFGRRRGKGRAGRNDRHSIRRSWSARTDWTSSPDGRGTTSPPRTARPTARSGSSRPRRRAGGPGRARRFPGHRAGRAERPLRLGRELQSLRRHGAVVGLGRLHRRHAGGAPDPDLHHAPRVPALAGRQAPLFRLHDERRPGRDRRRPHGGRAPLRADRRAGARHGGRHPRGRDGHGQGRRPLDGAREPGDLTCSPTWAEPSADGRSVWVACNKANDLVEIDVASWTLKRRDARGGGDLQPRRQPGRPADRRDQQARAIGVGASTPRREASWPGSRPRGGCRADWSSRRTAGTPSSRRRAIGSEPGTVDVVDLRAMARVASADVGQQAGGIDFWKVVPAADTGR